MNYETFNGITWFIAGVSETVKSFNNISLDFQNPYLSKAMTVTLVGLFVVFGALAITAIVVAGIAKLIKQMQLRNVRKSEMGKEPSSKHDEISGEINAAISMALHMYFAQVHDQESTVLTINRVPRPYSPWSSKIYNIRKHI